MLALQRHEMKRIGQLIEAIAAPDNLRLAFWKAARCE